VRLRDGDSVHGWLAACRPVRLADRHSYRQRQAFTIIKGVKRAAKSDVIGISLGGFRCLKRNAVPNALEVREKLNLTKDIRCLCPRHSHDNLFWSD
jgi:hypothetical protein